MRFWRRRIGCQNLTQARKRHSDSSSEEIKKKTISTKKKKNTKHSKIFKFSSKTLKIRQKTTKNYHFCLFWNHFRKPFSVFARSWIMIQNTFSACVTLFVCMLDAEIASWNNARTMRADKQFPSCYGVHFQLQILNNKTNGFRKWFQNKQKW